MLRRQRRWLSGWLVVFLLFMQGATAAYACPAISQALAGAANSAANVALPDCHGDLQGMDAERPQLCKSHCETGQQSVNSAAGAPDAPLALAQGPALMGVLPLAEAAQLATLMPAALAAGPPVGAPALYITLLVLRN